MASTSQWPIRLLALLMCAKALFLAFWVTPLDMIPDERAHFSYVADLASGRGMPLLGQAYTAGEIFTNKGIEIALKRDPSDTARPFGASNNWIAQHPPVYHALAAIPLKLGLMADAPPYWLYRLPRLISALALGVVILALFHSFVSVGLDTGRSTLLAASLGFIPMVSHLASGTNHDILLLMFSSLATLYLVRFLMHEHLQSAYICAFWLCLAAGTKMTAWVMLAIFLVIIAVSMRGPVVRWLGHMTGVAAIALTAPIIWMARNIYHFGNPFKIGDIPAKQQDITLVELVQTTPLFEQFFLHFYGLVGWKGQRMMLQVDGVPKEFFSLLLFGLALFSIVYLVTIFLRLANAPTTLEYPIRSIHDGFNQITSRIRPARALAVVCMLAATGFSVYAYAQILTFPSFSGHVRIATIALTFFLGISSLVLISFVRDVHERLFLLAWIAFFLFGSILLTQIYTSYVAFGWLRAIHGRYFYPLIPMLLVAVAILLLKFQVRARWVAMVAAFLLLMEVDAYLLQIIPHYFYRGGHEVLP